MFVRILGLFLVPAASCPLVGPIRRALFMRQALRPRALHIDLMGIGQVPSFLSSKEALKNDKTRRVPITPRLMELLEQRRFVGPDGYVFGDERGGLVEDIKKPWGTVNLIAHGYRPEWTVGGNLSKKCWGHLRKVNLHWHDLRHEALSRLGESGELTDHELMEIAGHANLSTTQRYLNTRIERLKQGVLRAAAKRLA
jgi:integrase